MSRDYREVLGSLRGPTGPLRRGITTGTCAAAAAAAAARALVLGDRSDAVEITLPPGKRPWSGERISVPAVLTAVSGTEAAASVRKDAGDDADITNGAEIRATVRITDGPGIAIRGGRGVGTVTRPGLPVPVGEAAINPVPRAMIRAELERLAPAGRGFDVLIEIPEGEALAAKTWNPRIGVEGGLSIIGTSGVVEPASTAAFKRSVYRTAKAYAARGVRVPAVTSGYVGERYLKRRGVGEDRILTVGDHIGFALDAAARLKFESVELVVHVGKIVKVAAGIFNTHSKFGDARLETLAAHAGACGAPGPLVARLLGLKLAEEAVPLLRDAGFSEVFARIARRAAERSHERCGLPVSCVVLDLAGEELARWPDTATAAAPGAYADKAAGGVIVVGVGPGPAEYLLPAAREAAERADLLAGDARHLELFGTLFPGKRALPFSGGAAAFLDRVEEEGRGARVALLVSGDPCLYSLGKTARGRFPAAETVPGLSAFQVLCAKTGVAWDDAEFVSVHGRSLDRLDAVTGDRTAIVFADDERPPALIAARLAERLGGGRRTVVGERVGYADERIADTTLGEAADLDFGGLSVVVVPR